jgi:hypothetical protein
MIFESLKRDVSKWCSFLFQRSFGGQLIFRPPLPLRSLVFEGARVFSLFR